jgi:hypothetical protein
MVRWLEAESDMTADATSTATLSRVSSATDLLTATV